jgi:hypothetical protein
VIFFFFFYAKCRSTSFGTRALPFAPMPAVDGSTGGIGAPPFLVRTWKKRKKLGRGGVGASPAFDGSVGGT